MGVPFSFSVTAVSKVPKIPISSHSLLIRGNVVLVRESRNNQKSGHLYVDSGATEGKGTISTIARILLTMAGISDQDEEFGSAFDAGGNTSKRKHEKEKRGLLDIATIVDQDIFTGEMFCLKIFHVV